MVISQFVICYQVYQRVNTPMLHRQYLEITELIWEDGIAKKRNTGYVGFVLQLRN